MKVKSVILILATVALVLSSCSGKMSPTAYNDKIVGMEPQTFTKLSDLLGELNDQSITNDVAKKTIDSLVISFDKSNKELAAIKYPDKAEALQNAVIAFFKYGSDKMLPALKDVVSHEQGSDEYNNAWNKLVDLRDEGLKLEQTVFDEQAKFAQASGFQIK